MHQAQRSPERPLPPPVSLTSQSHHEKPPEVLPRGNGAWCGQVLGISLRSRAAMYASVGCRLRKVLVGLLEAEIQSKLGLMSLG